MLFSRKKTDIADEELILRYQKDGKSRWVGELFNRYAHLTFGVCMKYLKDEAEAKDAVLSLYEKLLKDLLTNDVESFRKWVYVVARNHCLMILRKRKQHNGAEIIDDHLPDLQPDELEEKRLQEAKLTQLEGALLELKPYQRQCVELFYLKQKCYQEVSDETGLSMKEVKSHIQNGKRNLKIILSSKHEF